MLSALRAWVQSPVRKLGSCELCSVAKNKIKEYCIPGQALQEFLCKEHGTTTAY